MSDVNEKPSLKACLEAASWRELVRDDLFGTVCDRANAYYAIVTFYYQQGDTLLHPWNLLECVWCFYKAKSEAHVAWQMTSNLERHLRERERDILVGIFEAKLFGAFGKPKRAQKIRALYRSGRPGRT